MSSTPEEKNSAQDNLPAPIAAWIKESTGAETFSQQRVAGGGASRQGVIVTLQFSDGRKQKCFLTYDLRDDTNAQERLSGIEAEATAIMAVRANTSMKVAEVLAYSEPLKAMLATMEPGDSTYMNITDQAEREQVADDFMAQLASLHGADISKMELRGFPAPVPPSIAIPERLAALRKKYERVPPDPLLTFALGWLDNNIPEDPQRIVLVHGDAGPANFLFENGKVTAVLDWEMTHFGDAVEDFAWIAIRSLLQAFVPMSRCISVYEGAGGTKVDVQKIRYYIIYNIINLAVESYIDIRWASGDFAGVLGDGLIFSTLHRRAIVETIAEYEGVKLEAVELPGPVPHEDARSYDVTIDEIKRFILPVVDDPVANARLRAQTRLLKNLRQKAVLGKPYAAMEKHELEVLFQREFADVEEAKAEFNHALLMGQLPASEALPLLHRKVSREVELLRPAMGRLAESRLPPLD